MKTIDKDRLMGLKRLVTHANCPDGYASASIIKNCLPSIEVVYVQYGTKALEELEAKENTIFCDISPPAIRVEEFIGNKTIVLDHHVTQKSVVEMFGDDGVYVDKPGVSGAGLAYFHVWKQIFGHVAHPTESHASRLATLAGIRDTWQSHHKDWSKACALSAVMMLHGEDVVSPKEYLDLIPVGEKIVAGRQRVVEEICEKGYSLCIQDTICVVLNNIDLISDVAEYLGPGVDLVVGFNYFVDSDDSLKIRWSTRTRSEKFDCSKFAASRGGGGHKKSAGYNTTVTIQDTEGRGVSPYHIIKDDLMSYLDSLEEEGLVEDVKSDNGNTAP